MTCRVLHVNIPGSNVELVSSEHGQPKPDVRNFNFLHSVASFDTRDYHGIRYRDKALDQGSSKDEQIRGRQDHIAATDAATN